MLIVFSILTIIFASFNNLITQNISTATRIPYLKIPIMIYIISYILYLFYKSYKLRQSFLLIICLFTMIIGMLTPFPKENHIFKDIHLYLTLISVILYFIYLLQYFYNTNQYHKIHILFLGITFISFILLISGNINGLVEICVSLLITILLKNKKELYAP